MEKSVNYKAGDLVTIKLDSMDAEGLNSETDIYNIYKIRAFKDKIVKHEPAPFGWADVRPGMAFKHDRDGLCWYSGPSYTCPKQLAVVGFDLSGGRYESRLIEELTRAPEHDIEVQS